ATGSNSCFVLGDYVWFGTNKGRIFRSKNKGKSWLALNSSFGNTGIVLSLAFKDSLNGVALNVDTEFTTFSQSSNGGISWQDLPSSPDNFITSISYVPGTAGTLIGVSTPTVLAGYRKSFYSTDFGANWVEIDSGVPYSATQFLSPTVGWTSRGIINSSSEGAMLKWDSSVAVSLEDELAVKVKLYPNPNRGRVKVSSPIEINSYTLYSFDGQLVQKAQSHNRDLSLNMEAYSTGIYFLELNLHGGQVIRKKVVKH
ncbi:MAG: T9SS type A sorting domain-containing protein, partial [Bacteroidota bacterium]